MDDFHAVVCIPCLLLGGSELATLAFVKALAQSGHDVTICCYYEHDVAMVRRFEATGARVVLLELPRGHLFCLFHTLVEFFQRQRPNVVHVQYFAPGMVPILAARWAGVKHVFATVHAAGQKGYGWKAKAMLRFSSWFTDHFFCVSQNAERFWFGSVSEISGPADWRKARHSTIYNCVDVKGIQAAGGLADRQTLCPGLPREARVIGIVGRLVCLKGHLTLLAVMKDVLAAVPDAYLLVIGEGPDEAVFRQEAEQLGVADHVIWKGRVEPEILAQYYHIMDVLAMPSHWEGFGLTVAEAMAAGRPVVGSDVPGLREVVEDGVTGFLVPVNDADALARRLIALVSNASAGKAMGRKGLDRARQFFDVAAHDRKWLEAYTSLMGCERTSAATLEAASTE